MNAETSQKILLIDDDSDLRNLLGLYFKMAGYENIFHASHGEEGIEQLKILTPDLIILDMMMPVLDGMGFLKWLKMETKQDIPVLALTGRSRLDTKTNAFELGVTDIVFKPCDPQEIVERAKKILASEKVT